MGNNEILIYLNLDTYLRQWFVNSHSGEVPVKLRKGSIESKILEISLKKWPKDVPVKPADRNAVPIAIPAFRYKPAEIYNYLPKSGREALVKCIRQRFDMEVWEDLHHFGRIGKELKEVIYAWMEEHKMENTEENWNAVSKRYQRQREKYMDRLRKKK